MKKIIVLLLFSVAITSYGQDSPQDLIDDFFDTYKKDAGLAIRELYKTNKWTERIQDDIEEVVNMVNGFTTDYIGEYYGYEKITSKSFAESFRLFSYMVKYDRQPIRFTFKFYKPDEKWVLFSFNLDDSIDDEIGEAAKLYYLDLD